MTSSTCGTNAVRRRPVAAAALLLHLLVVVLLPLVGSAHEAAGADQRIHIEQQGGSPSCPRGHDHHECVSCRLVTSAFLLMTGCRHAEFGTSIRQPPTLAITALLPRLLQSSPPSSRAPPNA